MEYILVVDDQSTVRNQLRLILEKANYQVLEAEDGKQALSILQTRPNINLIITDIHMPFMDGMSFLENLGQNKNFLKIPKFVLTTDTNQELKKKGKSLGVMYWILKPCSENGILKAVKEVFQRGNVLNLIGD